MTRMEKRAVPYRKTVFVCTNVRTDGRKACANPGRGGDELCRALKDAVKAAGIRRVRVARSGCLDLCERGPNIFLWPDGDWLSGVSPSDVPDLVKRLAE